MANYNVTTTTYLGTYASVATAITAAIEAVDTAKVIRHVAIHHMQGDTWRGILVIDA